MRALLDTSFFVATESGRPLGQMEGVTETEVSVVTLAELTLGVLTAKGEDRPARLATLASVESRWDPLPVDADVARQFASIVAALRAARRRAPILDALVAATAIVEQIPVVTQDGDYDAIPDVKVIRV
jgi:predicted nucleic acid-binding protein